jgi:hypothetical protein
MANVQHLKFPNFIRNFIAVALIALHFWVVGVTWVYLKGRMSTEEIMGTMAILSPVTAAIVVNILNFFATSYRSSDGPTHFIYLVTVCIAAPALGYGVYDIVTTYHDTPGADGNSLRIALGLVESTIAVILTLVGNLFSRKNIGPPGGRKGGGGDGSLGASG